MTSLFSFTQTDACISKVINLYPRGTKIPPVGFNVLSTIHDQLKKPRINLDLNNQC